MSTSVTVITTLSAEHRPADQATYTVSAIDRAEPHVYEIFIRLIEELSAPCC